LDTGKEGKFNGLLRFNTFLIQIKKPLFSGEALLREFIIAIETSTNGESLPVGAT
jgi:hypothetical protein